jgi:hypothetical protein
MARTGLRMMPTSPSPPLKFRTAGFPQYGFKASMSVRAFLQVRSLKPAPGIRSLPCSLLLPFVRFRHRRNPGSVSKTIEASPCRCAGGLPSLPQGSLAPVRVMLSRSIFAYYSPMRQSRRHAATSRLYAYTQRLRCAGAPRRPARPSLLLLPCFPYMPPTLPWWPTVPSHCTHTVIPGFLELLPSRHPQRPSLPAISDGVTQFRGCIVHVMVQPACLPSPPGWLRRDEATCSSPRLLRHIVTPASGVIRRRVTLGVRLDGRTGNLPSSGLSPDKSQQLVRLHNNLSYVFSNPSSLSSSKPWWAGW